MQQRQLPLLPGKDVLASSDVEARTRHATNPRLLLFQRHVRKKSYSDPNYGEITSITLESAGRQTSILLWTALLFFAAALVFVLSRLVANSETMKRHRQALAAAMAPSGRFHLLSFLRAPQPYLGRGPDSSRR